MDVAWVKDVPGKLYPECKFLIGANGKMLFSSQEAWDDAFDGYGFEETNSSRIIMLYIRLGAETMVILADAASDRIWRKVDIRPVNPAVLDAMISLIGKGAANSLQEKRRKGR